MKIDWHLILLDWDKFVGPALVFLACLAGGYIVRRILFHWLHRWHMDAEVIPVLRSPIIIWAIILGFDLATRNSVLPSQYVKPIKIVLEVLWIISITIIAAQILGNFISRHSERSQGTAPTLVKTLTEILVSIIGLLFLLNYLHVEIAPLLTALGVGGLAVALALQDTLSNLFAGLYISISNQIHVSDYVKLATGEEGYVTDITWRSTKLQSLDSNWIYIPNAKLSQTVVTNFHYPAKNTGSSVNIHVSFDSDTNLVEAVMVEEATVHSIEGLMAEPKPFVTWSPIADAALLFTLNFDVSEFSKQFHVKSELRKRIFLRLRKEGVQLPYPTQSIVLTTTSSPAKGPSPSHSQP